MTRPRTLRQRRLADGGNGSQNVTVCIMPITLKGTIYNIGYLAKKYNTTSAPTVTIAFDSMSDRAHFEASLLDELMSEARWTTRPVPLDNLEIYGIKVRIVCCAAPV